MNLPTVIRIVFLIAAMCFLSMQTLATPPLIPSKPVTLPLAEITKLEDIACVQPFKLKADTIRAYQYKGATTAYSYADITCKSHGELLDSPVFYKSRCSYAERSWSCEAADFHLIANINERKVDITTDEKKAALVYDTLKKLEKSYKFVNKTPFFDVVGNSCSVSTAANPDEFDFMCAAYFKVSLWCPQPETSHCPGILSMQNLY